MRVSPKFEFPDERPTKLRVAGTIAAGRPLEAIEDNETLDIDDFLARGNDTFALRVTGDSMIEDHIREGDFVICERRHDARNGDTVVALLQDGEATLKRFYREKVGVRLQPANSNYKPIYAENVNIQGVVIGVLRMM